MAKGLTCTLALCLWGHTVCQLNSNADPEAKPERGWDCQVMVDLKQIRLDIKRAIEGLLMAASLEPGQVLVVGCSTSEVVGEHIGTSSSLEVAEVIIYELLPPLKENGVYLAVQCCEHLNRALVVEKEAADKYGWEEVSVVPYQMAGGSLATIVLQKLEKAVVVEEIKAHAGIDIGDTFIGMHLKPVVVPVRLDIKSLGKAHLTFARTRPKLIGGERARYCR